MAYFVQWPHAWTNAMERPALQSVVEEVTLELNKLAPIRDSILACDPTVEIQLISLFVAALMVWLFMRMSTAMMSFVFVRSKGIREARIKEFSAIMENFDSFTILLNLAYDLHVVSTHPKLYVSGDTPTYAQWMTAGGTPGNGLTSFETYLSDRKRRDLFTEFACAGLARELSTSFVHSVAGALGLVALLAADRTNFLLFARLGVLWEAGYELTHYFSHVLPAIYNREITLRMVFTILHHTTLFTFLQINLVLLPGIIGREVAWSLFLMAGCVGPVGLLNFWKNQCDLSLNSDEINTYMTLQLIQGFFYISTRFFAWLYLANKMLYKLWNAEDFEPNFFALCSSIIASVTIVNLLICEFCRLGLIKATVVVFQTHSHTHSHRETVTVVTEELLKQIADEQAEDVAGEEDVKEEAKEEEEEEEASATAPKQRHASLWAPLVAAVNKSRGAKRKSENLMGFDMKDVEAVTGELSGKEPAEAQAGETDASKKNA
jgi:hypothetical protein